MADMYILTGNNANEWTIVMHFDVPDTKQSASTKLVLPAPPWPRTATFLMRSVVYSLPDAMRSPPAYR